MAANPALETSAPKILQTPSDMPADAIVALSGALNVLLADTFALYMKTKNFHWHASGPHFRDYHKLFDEQAAQVLAITDGLAERVRKIGGGTIRSIAHIGKLQRVKNNDEAFVPPGDMLRELMEDNRVFAASMRQAHDLCDAHRDLASASLLETWIDEAENRSWYLFETTRAPR